MKNIIIALLTVALIAMGWMYLQSPEDGQNDSDDNEVSVQSLLTVGVYEFDEVSSAPDLNGVTYSSWQHVLSIIDENTFEYTLDGRMAMVRVRGTIEQEDGRYSFIANENFLTDDESEPFPKFDSGTVLFTVSNIQDSNSLEVTWGAVKGNLTENTKSATFVRN